MSLFHLRLFASQLSYGIFHQTSWSWDTQLSQGLPLVIRTVRQHDLPRLADLLASSFHRQDGAMGWLYPLLRAGIYEDLRSRLQAKAPYQVCLVAVGHTPVAEEASSPLSSNPSGTRSGEDYPIGTVEISLRSRHLLSLSACRYLYLSNLAVRADYRRQGIAQQLLQAAERVALNWGFQDLYLHVLENNYKARRLYAKEGFQVQQAEANLGTVLLGQPRQLLLHKRLVREQVVSNRL